jgi:hypothetical protein
MIVQGALLSIFAGILGGRQSMT